MNCDKSVSIWTLLWQLIRYAPKLYLADTLLWMLIIGLPAIPGLLIREFFNTLTQSSEPRTVIVLLLATGLGRIVAILTGRMTKTQHRFTMSSLVQHNLLTKLMLCPGSAPIIAESRSVSPGEIISYFREDVAQVEDNVVGTNEILGSGLFALLSFSILLAVNFALTLWVFLPLILVAIIVQRAEHRMKHFRRQSRYATQQVTGLIAEMFGAVQAIQVAGAEPTMLNHLHQLNAQRRHLMVRDQVFTMALNTGLENLANLGTGLMLLLLALNPFHRLSVGDFALFVYYLAFVTEFLSFLGGFLTLSKQTEVAFERMGALLDDSNPHGSGFSANPSSTDRASHEYISPHCFPLVEHHPLYLPNVWGQQPPLPAVVQPFPNDDHQLQQLTASRLTYRYPGTTQGITEISFTLERGSLTVITGQMGAGKTTLLQALLGLLPLESGAIYWNQQRVVQPDRQLVPPRVAYTPQVPQLFSDSLRNNILLGLEVEDARLQAAIVLAGLDADIAAMPDGLDTPVGTKGMGLSGGQIQRVAAARMFVRQPELLVFDDLSSALDIETELNLWSRLFALKTWTPTCLVVSHRRPLLQRADRIVVLKSGRIEA